MINGVQTWDDIKPKFDEWVKKDKKLGGTLFEVFCKYFFLIEPTFKDEYKNVWLFNEVPYSFKTKLGFSDVEYGIDLILENEDGLIVGVQSKYRTLVERKIYWSKDKLANLVAYGNKCDRLIVFSNVQEIDNQTDKSINQKVLLEQLDAIENSTFRDIESLLKGLTPNNFKKFNPLPHQKVAINKVDKHFENNDRAQLILPCGAGKSLTSLWIKEKLNPVNTIVLVPSLALLRQMKNEWARHKKTKYKYLCVCSEKDIDRDAQLTEFSLAEIGGNVSLNPTVIAKFLSNNKAKSKIIFSTYQSLQEVEKATNLLDNFKFDLAICDEAHKTAGNKQKVFGIIHENFRIGVVKRLYMTATPRVASQQLKNLLGDKIKFLYDMSNERVFGKEAHRMSFAEAIPNILCDYKIIGIGVSDQEVKKFLDQRNYVTSNETIDEYAHNYALKIAMEKYKAFHALSFHHTVKGSKSFSERHINLFGDSIFSKFVSGNQSSGIRQSILKEFSKREIGIVANARCLTEGVDVPTIDLIYFCDPKNSKVSIVQAAGRALRKDRTGKKTLGYIVVPIFHKLEDNIEKAVDRSVFKNVIQVIRSLCDHDERLQAEINDIAFKKGKKNKNSKIEFSFSNDETERIIKLVGFKEKLKTSLFNQIIEKTNDSWDLRYRELTEYFNANGNSDVPARYVNRALGTWCVAQRVRFNSGKLSAIEIKRLENIDFNFKPRGNNFNYLIDKLSEFKSKYGHANIPILSKDYSKSGKIINRYRHIYNKGIKQPDGSVKLKYTGKLKKEEIQKLDDIGFKWQVRRRNWLDNYKELEAYYYKNNGLKGLASEDEALYHWLYNTRKKIKTLSKSKRDKLELLGVEPINIVIKKDRVSWDENYILLKKFKKKFGHVDVPRHLPKYNKLYKWVKYQLNAEKYNRLSSEKVNRLENIGLINKEKNGQQVLNFEESKEVISQIPIKKFNRKSWSGRYNELKDFFEKHNHSHYMKNDGNATLYHWVLAQRVEKKKGKLSQNRIDKLDKINFVWEPDNIGTMPDDDNWLNHLIKLREYKDKFGHTNVSQVDKNPAYKKLGKWLNEQRNYKKGRKLGKRIVYLTEEKEVLLNDLGIIWDVKEHEWNQRLRELKSFHEKFNSWKVPLNGKEYGGLGHWIYRIKKNGITPERAEKLKQIGYNVTELLIKT
ncbi:Helicase associated domain protein [Flavobacteriaceae bacterium F89]|uniref:Helicase associated domain protein n=1 Tax=Cerina litoralis TaxID=2874477 RepID=A0AAE3ESY4_9FLAO|nr:Helicase associated domain protein [Cerina litoralis]MCG2459619.1 Helicase associated domain protein [Cerina litoralis]